MKLKKNNLFALCIDRQTIYMTNSYTTDYNASVYPGFVHTMTECASNAPLASCPL
jgi:hypothetical protein